MDKVFKHSASSYIYNCEGMYLLLLANASGPKQA